MAKDYEQSNGGGGFFFGLLVGALIGAIAALLYAPATGDDTRDLVGRKSN